MPYTTKPNGDAKAKDGVVAHGWRRVSKDGSVRFANSHWQDDRLKDFAGQFVLVDAGDVWLTYAKVLLDGWRSQYQRTFTIYPVGKFPEEAR